MFPQSKVVVGVCTCRRPKMLRACLDSLAAQILPTGIDLKIVVVDNEEAPNNREGVEAFAAVCRFPVHYVHQPRRGIAMARNSILDKAMELGADWIAMLDDDETADIRWIADLMIEDYRHLPVLMGYHQYIYPEPRPFWVLQRKAGKTKKPEFNLSVASTSNVRFSTDLVRAGLRFDESLAFLPTEDWRFFNQAHKRGFQIGRNPSAITREVVHPERLTYRALYRKNHAHFAAVMRNDLVDRGRSAALLRLPEIAGDVLLGIVELALAPLAAPFSAYRFKFLAMSGSKKIARSTGMLAAIVGQLPQPYRQVVGH
jgi:succinoglycan biosynthesis protein ExoM